MKPHQILLMLLAVFVLLLGIMLIFPEEGIKITDNFSLQFKTYKEFFSEKESVDITDIIEDTEVTEDTIVFVEPEVLDSAYIDSVLVVYKPVPIGVDSVRQYLEFPAGNRDLLDTIFAVLANLKNTNDLIRILHYGDSQIEVDRMTSYIRYKLQAAFGGSGPGFLPAEQVFGFKQPMVMSSSDNWHRYTIFPRKDSIIDHKRFGILGNFYSFTAYEPPDSLLVDSSFSVLDESLFNKKEPQTAWLKFENSPVAFDNVRKYTQAKMFFGYNKSDFNLKVFANEQEISNKNIRKTDYLSVESWDFGSSPQEVSFEFSGTDSPEIYGFTFDGYRGVAVDNIPVRGSSGLFFARMDLRLMQQMYQNLNVKLIILQFGGNRVPYDSTNIVGYKNYFGHQIKLLQSITNNVPIIVIGPGDMSQKVKDNYETHENLETVRNMVRLAALENNCAFWDMYEAMGGRNSMASWVFHDPPLASKDFIHFTPNGARIVAQMFYNALIYEYNSSLN